MIKVNTRVLQLVKHHDYSIYFRYSITHAQTYVIVILCVPIATHGHLTSEEIYFKDDEVIICKLTNSSVAQQHPRVSSTASNQRE